MEAPPPCSCPFPPPPNACTHDYGGRHEHSESYGEPMLWIGIYVAAASLLCTAAIAADIIWSFNSWKKPWIIPKFFVLNATVVTALGIATKIPADVNGPMPGLFDQLSKLSGIILICVAMNHTMPSLGVMDTNSLLANMAALGILVVSTAIDIWFQIKTGLISKYAISNTIYTLVMLFMYAILVSHALGVTAVKALLESQYEQLHGRILKQVEVDTAGDGITTAGLKRYVCRYWLMALTSSPDYVLRSSGMSSAASVLLCFLLLAFLFSAMYATRLRQRGCYVNSDYKWATGAVLFIQLLAGTMGVILSLLRFFYSRVDENFGSIRKLLYVESYRLRKVQEWKRRPLPLDRRRSRRSIKLLRFAMDLAVFLLVLFQRTVALLTRILLLVTYRGYALVVRLGVLLTCGKCLLRCNSISITQTPTEMVDQAPSPPRSLEVDDISLLKEYVLVLEGRKDAEATVRRWKDHPDHWFKRSKCKKPQKLLELLVRETGRSPPPPHQAPARIPSDAPTRSWSLELATFACLVHLAVTSEGGSSWKELAGALEECFFYAVFVDRNKERVPSEERDAARMVWEDLLLHSTWAGERLSTSEDEPTVDGMIRHLKKKAEDKIIRSSSGQSVQPDDVLETPTTLDASAAESMARRDACVSRLKCEVVNSIEKCLSEHPAAILHECSAGSYGSREQHVKLAAGVLGEVEELLNFLEKDSRTAIPRGNPP